MLNAMGEEGRTHKPVWEAKEGRCAGCCWERGGAVQNEQAKPEVKEEDGAEDSIEEMLEGWNVNEEGEGMILDGIDKAIEEVEMEWENAVLDIEVRKKAEKAARSQSAREEAEKEKSVYEGEQRVKSVVEGRMWNPDTVSPTNGGKKKGEKKEVKKKGGEVVSARLSKEEKKRNRVVGDMIERNKIVGAWGLLRGEALESDKRG